MLRLLALAALCVLLQGEATPARGALEGAPTGNKVTLRAGERLEFGVAAAGPVRWRLDGVTVASGSAWTFAPSAADAGRHEVAASVPGARRVWAVRVRPPRLPRVAAESPAARALSVPVDDEVELRFEVRPGAPQETIRVVWTVDGQAAGEGDTLRWRASEPSTVRVRALALGSLGGAVGRDWRIDVRLPPPTTTTQPAVAVAEGEVEPLGPLPPQQPAQPAARDAAGEEPERAGEERAPAQPLAAQPARAPEPAAAPEPEPVPPPPPPPPPPVELAARSPVDAPPAGLDDEIRRLLERYVAAWRNRDVGELQRIGQIASPGQAADLERYFAKVRDLDVEVNLLDVRSDGDRATVRFTRRDRFRDPTGRLVTQESPPIEKRVVRSPEGLRFEPGGR